MPDAATALQILGGATAPPDASGAAPVPASAAPVQQSATGGSEPFNPSEWTPAPVPVGTSDTGITLSPTQTNGFENKRTGEWMRTLPIASGPSDQSGNGTATTGGAGDPNAIGAKLDILSQASTGKLPAPPPAPPAPTAASTASNVGAGANDAIASTLGAPVDAATWALNKIPGVNIQSPFGGSDSIKSLMGAIGADPRNIPANNTAERIARGTGAGMAGMVLPFGAARAASEAVPALSMFGQGSLTGNAITGAGAGAGGAAAEEATPEPYKPLANFAGQLLGGGATAATFGATNALSRAAGQYASNFTAPFTAPGQARLAGQKIVNAASNPAALPDALNPANPVLVPGSQPTSFQLSGDQGVGNLERATATQNPEPFLGRRADQNAARVGVLNSVAPEGSASSAATSFFEQKLADLDAANDTLVGNARNKAASDLSSAQSQADALVSKTSAQAHGGRAAAQARLLQANRQGVRVSGGNLERDQYGSAIRSGLAEAKAAAKQHEGSLWKAIDPDGKLRIDASPVQQAATKIAGEISEDARPMDGEEKAVFGRAKMSGTAMSFHDLTALRGRLLSAIREERFNNGETPALRRMTQLREAIDRAVSTAADRRIETEEKAVASGQMRSEDTIISKLQAEFGNWKSERDARAGSSLETGTGSILSGGEGAVPAGSRGKVSPNGRSGNAPRDQGLSGEEPVANFGDEDAARYRAAADATRERAKTFNSGPVDEALRSGKGDQYRLADSQVAGKFFNSGAHSYEDVTKFLAAVGGRPQAVSSLRDYAISSLRRAAENGDGTLNATKADAWVARHQDALRHFPDLGTNLRDLISQATAIDAERDAATQAAKEVARNGTQTVRDAETTAAQSVREADREGSSLVRATEQQALAARKAYLNTAAKHFIGADPIKAVGSALASKNPSAAFAQLAKMVAGNVDAKEGLQRAVADYMEKKFLSNVEAMGTGTTLMKSDAFQTFIKKNRSALSWVFPKEQLDGMEAVAADLQRSNRSIVGSKLPGQSNSAQDIAAGAKHGTGGHGGSVLAMIAPLFVEQAAEHAGAGGLSAIGTAFGAAVATKLVSAMRAAGIHKVNDLVTQAMLDPKLARALVMKVQENGKPDPLVVQTIINRLQSISVEAAAKNADR